VLCGVVWVVWVAWNDGGSERKMSVEDRIRYMLRAATRAEDEGDSRLARLYRRMAEEAQPVNVCCAGLSEAPAA